MVVSRRFGVTCRRPFSYHGSMVGCLNYKSQLSLSSLGKVWTMGER